MSYENEYDDDDDDDDENGFTIDITNAFCFSTHYSTEHNYYNTETVRTC